MNLAFRVHKFLGLAVKVLADKWEIFLPTTDHLIAFDKYHFVIQGMPHRFWFSGASLFTQSTEVAFSEIYRIPVDLSYFFSSVIFRIFECDTVGRAGFYAEVA